MSRPNQDTDKRVMQRIKKAREGTESTTQEIQKWLDDNPYQLTWKVRSFARILLKRLETAHTRTTEQSETIADMDVEYGLVMDKLEPLEKIYNAVNLMMNELGAAGGITTDHDTVCTVMDALHDFDGGVYTRIDLEDK